MIHTIYDGLEHNPASCKLHNTDERPQILTPGTSRGVFVIRGICCISRNGICVGCVNG